MDKTIRITFSNSAGVLERKDVKCRDYADQRIGEAVVEMIRQSGMILCAGDCIRITALEG